MKVTLLRFDFNRKVIGQWEQEHDQVHPYPDVEDFTGHRDGPKFMRRIHNPATDTFSPIIVRSKTRRQILKEITNFTDDERDEAIRALL